MHRVAAPYPASELTIDPVLMRKYDVSGPRYTSYPTADRFVEAFGAAQLEQWLAKRNVGGISQALSVYVRLSKSAQYIKYLEKELALLEPLLSAGRDICQLHWGGGTPTFLPRQEVRSLVAALERTFVRSPNAEYSIEVDPRPVEAGTMAFLGELGFNRLSVDVQDFDPAVQRAVHRIQSEEVTRRVIVEARASGFRSVNVDLIYGLPRQTLDSFQRTLDKVIGLDPDRITLYSYAHPPSPKQKLQIMTLAIGQLTREGYVYIGMDHFARPDDALAIAQSRGLLQRSVQGYSTCPESDLLGLGVSAIGRVGPIYYQNRQDLAEYCAALEEGRLPVARGVELTQDDLARRAIIQALTCSFRLSIESIELAYLLDFHKVFAEELSDLRKLQNEGLVELLPDWIVITPKGRLLVRPICMVFDKYLRTGRQRASYSKML